MENIVTPQEKETEYTSMKRFWTYIKHKCSGNVGVSSLKSKGKLYSHPLDKAELLNKQFQSVFISSDEVSREVFVHSCQMPSSEDDFPVMEDINITESGIRKLLMKLNPSKSPGPDSLAPRVLKELADDTAPILLSIFRRSLASSEVPKGWRTANVVHTTMKNTFVLTFLFVYGVCMFDRIAEHELAEGLPLSTKRTPFRQKDFCFHEKEIGV